MYYETLVQNILDVSARNNLLINARLLLDIIKYVLNLNTYLVISSILLFVG